MADEAPSQDASTRWIETSRGILRYSDLAPLLAERVLHVQQQIEAGAYGTDALDEYLVRKLHRDFCADLVPDLSGKWRVVQVRVGTHEPAPPHLVPVQMREYALDLRARLDTAASPEQLPEVMAFAEGRLLSIHPFADFNGRLTRLWLWELMRRSRLPPVHLVSTDATAMGRYLECLRHADRYNYGPLIDLWKERLAHFGSTSNETGNI
jgi:CRISPR-associated endonuclease/helicase Cas3